MNILILLNDPPYGTEKAYNALRLTMALQIEHRDIVTRVFLMADAIGCAVSGQVTPQGYRSVSARFLHAERQVSER